MDKRRNKIAIRRHSVAGIQTPERGNKELENAGRWGGRGEETDMEKMKQYTEIQTQGNPGMRGGGN